MTRGRRNAVIRTIDTVISWIEIVMIVGLTLAGLAMAFAQVVLRYVFNTGIHWLEAGLVTALIWAMLFGAVRATRQGIHPRVDLLSHMVGPRARAVLNAVSLVATLSLVLYFLWDAVFYARFIDMIGALHPELEIKQLYPFLVVPVITALMAVRYILIAWALWHEPDALQPDGAFRARVGDDTARGSHAE